MEFNYEKERQEAIAAGKKALQSLYNAQNELNSARNWGIFDMLGGGFVTDLIKHSKMNKAQGYMELAKMDLKAFSKELEDISEGINVDFNTGDFLTFADYFLDGFVTDLLMQDRIVKAREQVNDAIRRIEDILEKI